MNCYQITGLLPFIVCLLVVSCDDTQVEPGTDFQPDQETAEIKAELHLMNLSQDTKNHTLKFGNGNAFMKPEDVPAQAAQIHEKSFYICPVAHNPRLLLVGKIRVEVHKNPDSNPQ